MHIHAKRKNLFENITCQNQNSKLNTSANTKTCTIHTYIYMDICQ